jgi:hypothetical protein
MAEKSIEMLGDREPLVERMTSDIDDRRRKLKEKQDNWHSNVRRMSTPTILEFRENYKDGPKDRLKVREDMLEEMRASTPNRGHRIAK